MSSVPSEQVVDVALAALEAVDHDAAQAARAAYGSLTFGEGLQAITGHGVADFLWYQLPTKWLCDLDEKLFLAAALGELFTRLGMPRYAAMCTADTTAEIITAYDRRGRAAGLKEYRLLGNLRRRLRLLGLTTQERLGQPTRLTPTGHAAAHTALRARALRPRQHPIG